MLAFDAAPHVAQLNLTRKALIYGAIRQGHDTDGIVAAIVGVTDAILGLRGEVAPVDGWDNNKPLPAAVRSEAAINAGGAA